MRIRRHPEANACVCLWTMGNTPDGSVQGTRGSGQHRRMDSAKTLPAGRTSRVASVGQPTTCWLPHLRATKTETILVKLHVNSVFIQRPCPFVHRNPSERKKLHSLFVEDVVTCGARVVFTSSNVPREPLATSTIKPTMPPRKILPKSQPLGEGEIYYNG